MDTAAVAYIWIPALAALVLAVAALFFGLRSRGPGSRSEAEERLAGRLEEIDRISSRLEDLRGIFVTPHIRGGVGETLLEELIKNWLPSQAYRFQYGFRDGARADAVILLGSYMVAVDSKFPLESVQELFSGDEKEGGIPASVRRSLLTHGQTISSKYIRPEEGTLQFALMYIPSEAVFYRCFVRDDELSRRLLELNVVPAGPYSLFLYIQTVAYGLRGFAFPERSRELAELSYRLSSEVEALSRELGTATTHLKNLGGAFDAVDRRARRLRRVAEGISGNGDGPAGHSD